MDDLENNAHSKNYLNLETGGGDGCTAIQCTNATACTFKITLKANLCYMRVHNHNLKVKFKSV